MFIVLNYIFRLHQSILQSGSLEKLTSTNSTTDISHYIKEFKITAYKKGSAHVGSNAIHFKPWNEISNSYHVHLHVIESCVQLAYIFRWSIWN